MNQSGNFWYTVVCVQIVTDVGKNYYGYINRIAACGMKFIRRTAGYKMGSHKK